MTFVVLDIETVPDRERWKAPEPETFPPAWAHKVVCIGLLALDEACSPIASGTYVGPEREVLGKLAAKMGARSKDDRPVLVTYNGRGFDLPVILQRSLALRVGQPWFFSDRDYRYRYSERLHIDLCDVISEHGAVKSASLDAVAKLVGLPGKQGVDGSDVERLVNDGRIEDVRRYCLDDVRQTACVFAATWLLRGHMSDMELAARIVAINEHFANNTRETEAAQLRARLAELGAA